MIKKLRLALAAWALKTDYIADFNKTLYKKLNQFVVELVTKRLAEIVQTNKNSRELSIEVLCALILASDKLNDLQKDQLNAILSGRNDHYDYLR